ncbi:nitroreductase family deazaflavin-dependent oxidoreductase [Nocardia callitridis]|uniref:Nitroreductase n=1 Tax=Nocardia callitridis TaxID=648753 RepID=A0ABP9KJ69_9NOCA
MTEPVSVPSRTTDRLVAVATRALRNRHLMRAPIWIYRARLGFLLGPRVLMLEHVGRKSGARRYVVLEVVDHPEPDSYVVVSGFGTAAQWFRNIQAQPEVHLWVGRHGRRAATASVLPQDRAAATLQDYAARNARAWAKMKPAIENTLGATIDEADPALPIIELRLAHG